MGYNGDGNTYNHELISTSRRQNKVTMSKIGYNTGTAQEFAYWQHELGQIHVHSNINTDRGAGLCIFH